MNENNGYGYTPVGTKWLTFITYISFPFGALLNIIDALSIDYSTMDSFAKIVFGAILFYGIAVPVTTSILLHKKRIEGYFLSFIAPISNAFIVMLICFLAGSSNIASDVGAACGALVVFFINYFYMKKRRFLFTHDEIGPNQFNAIGVKVGLVICVSLLAITALYSALLQSYNAIDQEAYIDLLTENEDLADEIAALTSDNESLAEQNAELDYKAQFVDSFVRFVTETGEKYHRYECQHIQNSSSIYYIFIDDPSLSYYSPCADCNP